MTIFEDPNREAVGLDPIWTEAENPPLPDPAQAPAPQPAPVPQPAPQPDPED
jgi:hypothetical protein